MHELRLQAVEDVCEDDLKHVERLKVMLFDLHLNIKPSELGEVSVRVAGFGAKYLRKRGV
jgi:hypothetical protein